MKLKLFIVLVIATSLMLSATACASRKIEFEQEQKPDENMTQTAEEPTKNQDPDLENIEAMVDEIFYVWKAFDQCAFEIFSDRDALTESALVNLYSRYCMSTPLKEELLDGTGEKVSNGYEADLGELQFKGEDLEQFAQKYFNLNLDSLAASPRKELYHVMPTPPVPIEILLQSYQVEGNQVTLAVEYKDDVFQSCQVCHVTAVLHEGGFYFESCQLIYDSNQE